MVFINLAFLSLLVTEILDILEIIEVNDNFKEDDPIDDIPLDLEEDFEEQMHRLNFVEMISYVLLHMTIVINLNTWGHYYITIQDTLT